MRTVVVHVNQHIVKHNAKTGDKLPTLSVKHFHGTAVYAHEVMGMGRVIDSNAQGRKPLSCGARVWMEFDPATFGIVGKATPWDEVKNLMWDQGLVAA